MKVLVIGSGLIGVSTAYFLIRQGHDVVVLDRRSGPGLETSFANGALITPSMSNPWNAPGCWRVLLSSFFQPRSPLQLRIRALPSVARWGLEFLANSRQELYEHNTRCNLKLGLYSVETLRKLRAETSIQYDCRKSGTLKIFRDQEALENAKSTARVLACHGLQYVVYSPEETAVHEPGLTPIVGQLVGSIFYPGDESGDAYKYCSALAEFARTKGVQYEYGAHVSSIELRSGKVTRVRTDQRSFTADCYVVAAGSFSVPLLRSVGIDLPVRPAKGYSLTFDKLPMHLQLRIPVVDDHLHAVLVPLGGRIRAAGTAEFAGFDLSENMQRIEGLLHFLEQVLPENRFDASTGKAWCGLRPMSVDGVPIIGPTQVSNLYVNTGHGHLGWTMAAGSGQLLADIISNRSTAIDPIPFSTERFSTAKAIF